MMMMIMRGFVHFFTMGASMCLCKCALLFFCVIFPLPPRNHRIEINSSLWKLISSVIQLDLLSIGNKNEGKKEGGKTNSAVTGHSQHLKSKVRMYRKKPSQQISIKQEGKTISFSSISLMHILFRFSLKCGVEALQLFSGCVFMTHIPD